VSGGDAIDAPWAEASPRDLGAVAEECVGYGIGHIFYGLLARVYEKGKAPIAADAHWHHDRIDLQIQCSDGGWSQRRHFIGGIRL
jgi:hypothetical protein